MIEVIPYAYKPIRLYVSPTLRQEFPNGTSFPINSIKFDCTVSTSFAEYHVNQKAVIRVNLDFDVSGFLNFVGEAIFKVKYETYEHSDQSKIDDMVIQSFHNYFEDFKEREQKLDLEALIPVPVLLTPSRIQGIRNDIISGLREKDSL